MRGSSGKKTAGPQQKNLEAALPGRWGGRSAENPPSGSVRKTRRNKQKTPGNGDGGSTSEAPQPPRKKRARADPTVESEDAFKNRMEVKVKIPEELKPWLVEDWDLVTRQKQLFQLPAKKNVDTILEEYANCKRSQGNVDNKEYAVNEVVGGIKEYFNVMLGTQLLYKFERPQYAEILLAHPDAPMSQPLIKSRADATLLLWSRSAPAYSYSKDLCVHVCSLSCDQLFATVSNYMDCCQPGSSINGMFQMRK
ncbi:hypothetical protein R6Z07F_020523 [Ovis aries]